MPRVVPGAIQKIFFVAGALLSGYLIYLIALKIDVDTLLGILRRSNPFYVMAGFAVLSVAYVFRTARLHFIVSQHSTRSTFGKCAKAILVGVAINNVYPFRLGDLYRVVAFRSTLGIDGAKMLGALAIERVSDLVCMFVFMAIALSLLPGAALDAQIRLWGVILLAAVIVACVLMLFTPRPLRRLLALLAPRTAPLRGVIRFADSLLEGVASAVAPRPLVVILALALTGWTVELALLSWTICNAIGLEGNFPGALLGAVLGGLSTLFPSVPGYVGTYHYFAVLGITEAGGDANQAAAFAILVHTMIWLFTTASGAAYFLADGWGRYRPYEGKVDNER